jgi:hypothetical protein
MAQENYAKRAISDQMKISNAGSDIQTPVYYPTVVAWIYFVNHELMAY